jgi:hypothetical protein
LSEASHFRQWHFPAVRHRPVSLGRNQGGADILIARHPSSVIRTTVTSIGSRPAITRVGCALASPGWENRQDADMLLFGVQF